MILQTFNSEDATSLKEGRSLLTRIKDLEISFDTLLFIIFLGFCNFHLISKESFTHLAFIPSEFVSGERYRLLTFSFVHVSWYHFCLDAGAFLFLYTGLTEKRIYIKLLTVGACGLSSLVAAILFSPQFHIIGLCGLSGIAHGLMAISALELMEDNNNFKLGLVFLLIVCIKSIIEVMTGNAIFSFLHMEQCGTPIAICHAGGVIGGIMSYLVFYTKNY